MDNGLPNRIYLLLRSCRSSNKVRSADFRYCIRAPHGYTTIYRVILLLERIYRFAPHGVLDKDEFHVSSQYGPDSLENAKLVHGMAAEASTAPCNGNLVGHELTCRANACYLDLILAVDNELWPGQKKTSYLLSMRPRLAAHTTMLHGHVTYDFTVFDARGSASLPWALEDGCIDRTDVAPVHARPAAPVGAEAEK